MLGDELSPERRSELARLAATARWQRKGHISGE
jgi:hypothetical protein